MSFCACAIIGAVRKVIEVKFLLILIAFAIAAELPWLIVMQLFTGAAGTWPGLASSLTILGMFWYAICKGEINFAEEDILET